MSNSRNWVDVVSKMSSMTGASVEEVRRRAQRLRDACKVN